MKSSLRIAVLSRKPRLYSTRRLREEVERAGHACEILDPLKCVLCLSGGRPSVLKGGRDLGPVDAVNPRVGTFATAYALSVVRHFEIMNVPVVNGHDAIARSKNKLGCLQLLAANRIKVPDTLLSRYPRHLNKMIQLVGGTPLIMKLLKGTQGTGVILQESTSGVESVLDTIWSLGEDILLQRYIRESSGIDLRALVIDGEVVACMRRQATKPGEFRSNIHRGGVGEKVTLSKECRDAAVRSAEIIGLKLAGVDILESKDGPLVIEVNSSPGFQGLEAATGLNIAGMIVDYTIRMANKKVNS